MLRRRLSSSAAMRASSSMMSEGDVMLSALRLEAEVFRRVPFWGEISPDEGESALELDG